MAKKIFVGGLAYRVTEDQVHDLFSDYGPVLSVVLISDRETGRPRGFGFVEMEGDADADAAIKALHQTEWEGRTLTVNEARPREPRRPRR